MSSQLRWRPSAREKRFWRVAAESGARRRPMRTAGGGAFGMSAFARHSPGRPKPGIEARSVFSLLGGQSPRLRTIGALPHLLELFDPVPGTAFQPRRPSPVSRCRRAHWSGCLTPHQRGHRIRNDLGCVRAASANSVSGRSPQARLGTLPCCFAPLTSGPALNSPVRMRDGGWRRASPRFGKRERRA